MKSEVIDYLRYDGKNAEDIVKFCAAALDMRLSHEYSCSHNGLLVIAPIDSKNANQLQIYEGQTAFKYTFGDATLIKILDEPFADITIAYITQSAASAHKQVERAEILEEAKTCVCGKREQDYGSPENNFAKIADLWSAYKGQGFSPLDVAMMMSLMKIARIKSGVATNDSFVDLAGYAACGGEIAAKSKGLLSAKKDV